MSVLVKKIIHGTSIRLLFLQLDIQKSYQPFSLLLKILLSIEAHKQSRKMLFSCPFSSPITNLLRHMRHSVIFNLSRITYTGVFHVPHNKFWCFLISCLCSTSKNWNQHILGQRMLLILIYCNRRIGPLPSIDEFTVMYASVMTSYSNVSTYVNV